jgi:hypothetical protein
MYFLGFWLDNLEKALSTITVQTYHWMVFPYGKNELDENVAGIENFRAILLTHFSRSTVAGCATFSSISGILVPEFHFDVFLLFWSCYIYKFRIRFP